MLRIWIILFFITLLGALLRYFNLSPFTIYPDSFQSLLVAENIKNYGGVVGYLGTNGLLFPESFSWSRPLYPLLIDGVSFFGVPVMFAARSITYILGVLAIPLAFLFVSSVFKNVFNENKGTKPRHREERNKKVISYKISTENFWLSKDINIIGLCAAFLLATSYNHTVWSGLLMTETTGVFFMLLFLWRLYATIQSDTHFFNIQDLLVGVLFALAVLTRYEYFVIFLPVIFLTFTRSPFPYRYLCNIFSSFIFVLVLVGYLIFPVNSVISIVLNQTQDLLLKVFVLVIALLLFYVLKRFVHFKLKNLRFFRYWIFDSRMYLSLFVLYVLLQLFFGQRIGFLYSDLSFIRNFIKHDLLLSVFSYIGFIALLKDTKQQVLAYFSLLSLILLGFIYHQVNPDMERYMTHLIPFLLIPASVGFYNFFSILNFRNFTLFRYWILDNRILKILILLLFLLQLLLTAYGLRNLNDPSWFRQSYEDKAAILTRQHISGNPILIVSFPEPYYFFLQRDTQSIVNEPPFIYIPQSLDNREVVIVEDMGMRDVFPDFSKLLDTKLTQYRFSKFFVNERYHYTNRSIAENTPVVLYKLKLKELRKIIK